MSAKTKQTIIAVIVIAVAFFGFKMFFTSDIPADQGLITQNAEDSYLANGEDILVLLGKLNNIQLDNSLFSNKIFLSLTSFERPLEEQVLGRPNPFLPIGRDSARVNATTTGRIE